MRAIRYIIMIVLVGLALIQPLSNGSAQEGSAPLSDELTAEFSDYMEEALVRWHIPGAAIAIVQDGEIVYAEGFGVRELGTDVPVTPDTQFIMGSMTKSVSDMLIAVLVDEGFLNWDTLAVEIWPDFQLSNPDVAADVTVRDLLSMRSGLREDGSLWQGQGLSAEQLMAVLAENALEGQPGDAFFYDNMGVAVASYLGAVAAGGEFGNLFNNYADLMQTRIFDPIGMSNATVNFDLEAARANNNPDLAWPHLWNESGQLVPAPIFLEGTVQGEGIIPAGGMVASANDVARYLITQLNSGISPDGERVVSAENLNETWTPQIAVGEDQFVDRALFPSSFFVPDDAQVEYGMGWFIGTYHGVRVMIDPGDERGYTNIMALLPETNTGIVIFTNGQNLPCARPMTLVALYRFVELLYGMDNQVDGYVNTILEMFGITCALPPEQ